MPLRRKLLLMAFAVFAALGLGTLRDHESLPPEELTEADLGSGFVHSFAKLSDGRTHYELAGPEDGRLVVMIHGVSGPMMVWDKSTLALHSAGYRTLRLDLYGRGYSARPDGADYDLPLYVRQVEELLKETKVPFPINLVGSSMGTIVATEYLVRHPENVATLSLIGPAGFHLEATPLTRVMLWPVLGDYLMRVFGDNYLYQHNREYFFRPANFTDFQARFEKQLQVKGSKHAMLETTRNVPLQNYVGGFAKVAPLGKPTLIVWGKEDQAFAYSHHGELQSALPGAKFLTVEEAGHLPQYERADVTSPALVEFLNANK